MEPSAQSNPTIWTDRRRQLQPPDRSVGMTASGARATPAAESEAEVFVQAFADG
jgi:hypothetical protein